MTTIKNVAEKKKKKSTIKNVAEKKKKKLKSLIGFLSDKKLTTTTEVRGWRGRKKNPKESTEQVKK